MGEECGFLGRRGGGEGVGGAGCVGSEMRVRGGGKEWGRTGRGGRVQKGG